MRRWCAGVLVACAAALGVVTPDGGGAASAATDPWADEAVLHAGYRLSLASGSSHQFLVSADGRFTLSMFALTVSITEEETVGPHGGAGATLWDEEANNVGSDYDDRSTLSMQRDGNLVFRRANGTVVWASGTVGSGPANDVRLQTDGNLVMRTSAGRVVWATGTTAQELVAGQHVAGGAHLVNIESKRRTGRAARMDMQRSGDLVLSYGAGRVWHSGSHVRGSHLTMTANGELVVVTPDGHIAWHSPAFGAGSVVHLTGDGRLVLAHGAHCWQRPAGTGESCGTG